MTATGQRSSGVVRRATSGDVDAIVRTLVESHLDYTWERWLIPDDATRAPMLAAIYRIDVEAAARSSGDIWVTDDIASVAVWSPIRFGEPTGAQRVAEIDELLGERAVAAAAVDRSLQPPPGRVDWYLGTMGTRPANRRTGLGSAVLEPKLHELDHDRHIARLDTSDPHNLTFYGRLGFSVVRYLDDLPHGAPPTWTMERQPIAAQGRGRPR